MMSRPERTVDGAVSQPIFSFSSKIFVNYAKYRLEGKVELSLVESNLVIRNR